MVSWDDQSNRAAEVQLTSRANTAVQQGRFNAIDLIGSGSK